MWHHWATGSHGLLLIRRLNPFCQPRRLFRFAGKHVHWPTKSFYRGSCYLERTSTRPTLTHGRLLGVHGSPHISRQQFRSKLKTHLFRQAYNTAWFLWEQFAEEWNFVIVIVINPMRSCLSGRLYSGRVNVCYGSTSTDVNPLISDIHTMHPLTVYKLYHTKLVG